MLEGLGIVPAIFERLAECESQVEVVLEGAGTGIDLHTHGGQFRLLEAKGFEVRKAPVGVAKTRLQRDRTAIRIDCLSAPPNGLECMTIHESRHRPWRKPAQQPFVHGDAAIEIPQLYVD